MKKPPGHLHDFEIDKLTNSIENVVTGDSFSTEISSVSKGRLKNVSKKNGWQFDWQLELRQPDREVFSLTINNNPNIIQGLISLSDKSDHIFMHLIESAPFNIGKSKIYIGVPANMVAYACKLSFQQGHDGYVAFRAKTQLIDHYINTLGARHFGGHLMVITTDAALKLTNKYF